MLIFNKIIKVNNNKINKIGTVYPYVTLSDAENGKFVIFDFATSASAYNAGTFIRFAICTNTTFHTLGVQSWVNRNISFSRWLDGT